MSMKEDVRPESFPDAYKAFLPVLERLTEPMLHVLQGHLLRLDALLNSVQSQGRNVQGEFEGIGGLTQRGDINRIVNSELLLRSEVPNEFLRRIAEGEALYMETEHSDPNERVVYRVLISVGPYMLGHGRLLALASLLFLARAALARKAELQWTFLPTDKTVHWFNGLSVNSVKRFLKFASVRDLTDADIVAAMQRWDAFNESGDSSNSDVENWLIGASGGANPILEGLSQSEALKNALILSIDPPPLAGPRTAILDLRRHGRNIRRLKIDFPEDSVCLSALNRPFNPERPSHSENLGAGGAAVPKMAGWEPRYVLSFDARHHVMKIDNPENGLLFLRLGTKNKLGPQRSFVPIPDGARLIGVHLSPNQTLQIMTQSSDLSEAINYYECNLKTERVTLEKTKPITSKHLFAKQRSRVVPPMVSQYNRLKCYTTLGQAFEFIDFREGEPTINILYKDNHIVHATAKYAVVLFNPAKKTQQELQAWSSNKALSYKKPSWVVMKDHNKIVDVFPCDEALDVKQLRSLVYTPSSHNLAYSLHPGEWSVMGPNVDKIDIRLAPYERILRCHLSGNYLKVIIHSDARLGGENTLTSINYVGGRKADQAKLFDFDKIKKDLNGNSILELEEMTNGGFRGVSFNEAGDPSKLIILRKRVGQLKAEIVDLQDALENANMLLDEG